MNLFVKGKIRVITFMKNFFLGFLLAATLLGAYDHFQKTDTLIKLNNIYAEKIDAQSNIIDLQTEMLKILQTPAQEPKEILPRIDSYHITKNDEQ